MTDFVTSEGRPFFPPSTDLVRSLEERASLAATLGDPNVTLARAAALYFLYKRKRLTEATQRGYKASLDDFTAAHPSAKLSEFEPPAGSHILEEYLTLRYGDLNARTYNKALSVLSDFFKWHVVRGTMTRDPAVAIERAKTRPVLRQTFSDLQVIQILAANQDPRDQIALRLLLFFGIRKGALRGIKLEDFDREKKRLVVFTKGEKFHTLPIVDDTIWQILDELREPGHHHLLPKRVTRKRTPPTRQHLRALAAGITALRDPLQGAAADEQCAAELALVLDAINIADARLALAVSEASTQATYDYTQAIGEHGAHLWWYRCLAKAGIVATGTTAGKRMHSARHTAIQRVLDKTGNLKAAQRLAGHANLATTGDSYTDWNEDQQADTMRQVLA